MFIDALSVAYRAFFAMRGLSTQSGLPTNAIFGFIKMIEQLNKKWSFEYCMAVFDGGLPKERMELLDSYKQQRPPMPEELKKQLKYIEQYLEATGIPWIRKEGMEADDIIASLAVVAKEQWGGNVILATSDKDFYQLVCEGISIVPVAGKEQVLFGVEEVKEKYGVYPEQIPDLLALTGDASDNIPGVHGIGPKTAVAILEKFGFVENLWQRIEEIENEKVRTALLNNREIIERNKKLTILNRNCLCGISKEDCKRKPPDEKSMQNLFKELEFKSLMRNVTHKNSDNAGYGQGVLFGA